MADTTAWVLGTEPLMGGHTATTVYTLVANTGSENGANEQDAVVAEASATIITHKGMGINTGTLSVLDSAARRRMLAPATNTYTQGT